MKLLLTTAILAGAAAIPAFAQDAATMTCADFLALDSTQQQEALTSIQTAMASGADATATDTTATDTAAADATGDAAATDTTATDTAAADTATDTTATDEAATDTAAADTSGDMEVTDTETTSADTSAEAVATEESATGAMDPVMASIMTACNADSTALVMDVATQAQAAGGADATADQ